MTDRLHLHLENEIAIMSALVELAHAVGYGTRVSAETITTLRERLHESERQRGVIRQPEKWPPGMQRADGSWSK